MTLGPVAPEIAVKKLTRWQVTWILTGLHFRNGFNDEKVDNIALQHALNSISTCALMLRVNTVSRPRHSRHSRHAPRHFHRAPMFNSIALRRSTLTPRRIHFPVLQNRSLSIPHSLAFHPLQSPGQYTLSTFTPAANTLHSLMDGCALLHSIL